VTYTATITSSPLQLRESRIVADLLLQGVDGDAWTKAIVDDNALQIKSELSVTRSSSLLRARLEPLGQGLWKMVRDGDKELAAQAAFAGAVRHSRLIGDFLDITIRDQRAMFADQLEKQMWSDYVSGCRGRDPDMPHWSVATIAKLRSIVFTMLAEVGYIQDTRSLRLQNVFIDSQLAAYLASRGEKYVLRCLQVTE
jgi:hypothetical protein